MTTIQRLVLQHVDEFYAASALWMFPRLLWVTGGMYHKRELNKPLKE